MASDRGVFLRQLKQGVRYARLRVSWAEGRLADAKRDLKNHENALRKWTAPDRRKNRRITKPLAVPKKG